MAANPVIEYVVSEAAAIRSETRDALDPDIPYEVPVAWKMMPRKNDSAVPDVLYEPEVAVIIRCAFAVAAKPEVA